MIDKIFKTLFFVLIVLFPTGELLRISLTNNVNIVPQDIVSLLLFLFVCIKFRSKKEMPRDHYFVIFFLSFIGFGTISLAINSLFNPSYNFLVSLLYGLRLVVYSAIFLYPLILRNKQRTNNLIFYSGSLVVIIGILQYFFYNNLAYLRYLGWDNHLYRLFSSFLDPNYAGIFYVVFLGFGVVRINRFFKRKIPVFEILILFLTVISIYLTYSRSAFIAFIVFASAVFIIQRSFLRVAVFLPLLIIFYLLFSDRMIEGLNPFRMASTMERVKSFNNTLVIFNDNMLIGTGFNSFRYAQIKYGYRSELGAAYSNADAGTDNSFLFVLTTTGIIGFVFFILAYFSLLKKLFNERNFESSIYFATVLSVFFGSLFVNALFYIPILSFLFLIIAFRNANK